MTEVIAFDVEVFCMCLGETRSTRHRQILEKWLKVTVTDGFCTCGFVTVKHYN